MRLKLLQVLPAYILKFRKRFRIKLWCCWWHFRNEVMWKRQRV